ncbi:pyocin knob domain-containing protein [Levilactobacillus brevis]|uniref:pyocin knob domain-containing protein n=1 Tax=Levilactobacillus brevis TaxID=1580 RepID=UPI001CDA5DD2|nr:pyocin knob domain-containing protein [Levilactobacillus brevis]
MATPNVGILTTAGKALIDKVNSGQAKISFSKIVFSSMDNSQLSDMQVKALTAIAPQEVMVSSPETTLDTNSGETRIRATGTNEKLADGVYVKTYGVFAKDDTGGEILYGVTVSPNPNYFPAYDGVTPQAVTYSYKTVIQETSNITMTNSNDVYASQEDLTEALQPYAKTVDVNQQLDKKVNIADMRKPASDVAGIEEVNAKQDKIGYTPADDSKVIHSTVTQLNSTDMNTVLTAGFYQSFNGTNGIPSGDNWTLYQAIPLSSTNGVQIAYETNNTILGMRSWNWNPGHLNFTNWVQFADDSKVAHLSGANNFDTVPTVNNNPLLLASSLPSDLARTGSDQEFTGKNTFDTAPIDKTTGNPYITKDGVPSDVARTSQQTNFTAGLQSGGVDVATAADLKSVADSAWRQLDNQYVTRSTDGKSFLKARVNSSVLYKIDEEKKFIYFSFIIYNLDPGTYSDRIDFSSIVKNISFPAYYSFHLYNGSSGDENTYNMSIANNQIQISGYADSAYVYSSAAEYRKTSSSGSEYSRCFVSYDELV